MLAVARDDSAGESVGSSAEEPSTATATGQRTAYPLVNQHGWRRSALATRVALAALLGLFFIIELRHLGAYPLVYEDEPWIASVGWKLARHGVFGSDMFTGYYGMDRHYYEFMPVYPMLQAALFRVVGVGLWQARLASVLLGLATLVLTYWLGRRLFGRNVGLLAVLLLVAARLTARSAVQVTGIPLVDIARIGRYDIAVPVFGLGALHAYLSARERARPLLCGVAGALAALAALSHLYGVFWIGALALLALWDRLGRRALLALGIGFVLPWIPYALFVAGHPADWVGQERLVADRFQLLRPAWYWANLRAEPRRYAPGLGSLDWRDALRPGLWGTELLLPASVAALSWRAVHRDDRAARAVVVPFLILAGCFAALITLKTRSYTAVLLPLAAIIAAWGALALWRLARERPAGVWLRPLLAALLLATLAEGGIALARIERAAPATGYADVAARLRQDLPPGSRVLGLHTYWFGLEDYDYRTWFVPLDQIDARFWSPPLSVDEALSACDPDVILIDHAMRAYFDEHPREAGEIRAWMSRMGFVQVDVFDDPSYGRFEVFRVVPGAATPSTP